MKEKYKKVQCPFCGYEMPIFYKKTSVSEGVFAICKGRNCKRKFKIRINDK